MEEEQPIIDLEPVAWQQRSEIGSFRALVRTIGQVLFKPADFFSRLQIRPGYGEALQFYVMVTTINLAIVLVPIAFLMLFASVALPPVVNAYPILFVIFFILCMGLLVGFSILILFVIAAIMHLFVILSGGKQGPGYQGTFGVLAYGTSGNILNIVPFLGGMLSTVWTIVIGVIGFKKVHHLSIGRAIFAYIAPGLLIVVGILAAIVYNPTLREKVLESRQQKRSLSRWEKSITVNGNQTVTREYREEQTIESVK